MDRLWAGWRRAYVEDGTSGEGGDDIVRPEPGGCVFCAIFSSPEPPERTYVLWRGEHTVAICNAFPYASGHLMAVPTRHVGDLSALSDEEADELWGTVRAGVRAIQRAYSPGGLNIGANLGMAAGAGVPDHLHIHALPRWGGDTNFMTTVAEARVLPESLTDSWRRLRDAWPT